MNRVRLLGVCIGVLTCAQAVWAETPFSFTADGGLIPVFDEGSGEGVSVFPLFMEPGNEDPGYAPLLTHPMPPITSIELVLTDLTHTNPADLDIYLISPFGDTLEIMTDRGDSVAMVNADFIFNDAGPALPPPDQGLPDGTYRPEGFAGMAFFVGMSGGTDAWKLLVIDDSAGDQGNLGSFTLRGTYVPEPVSLSLLAVGALAALRRSRRQ